MDYLIVPVVGFFWLCTVTPVPGIFCFHFAWRPEHPSPPISVGRFFLLIPATIFPVVLLALHASSSQPEWKEHGADFVYYLALGPASWFYFLPFAAANSLISRAVLDKEYAARTMLPQMSLVTCILICLFFTIGNLDGGWPFPLSAGCAYGYGLYRFIQVTEKPVWLWYHLLLFVGWLVSAFVTFALALVRTKQMVAELPDEPPPGCFVVTAAAKGHPGFVRSRVDRTTGKLTNEQLETYRAFERKLKLLAPRVHKATRAVYNVVGPMIARSIVFRWQADIMYMLLKPLECLIRMLKI